MRLFSFFFRFNLFENLTEAKLLPGESEQSKLIYKTASAKVELTSNRAATFMLKYSIPFFTLPLCFGSYYQYYVNGKAAESAFQLAYGTTQEIFVSLFHHNQLPLISTDLFHSIGCRLTGKPRSGISLPRCSSCWRRMRPPLCMFVASPSFLAFVCF